MARGCLAGPIEPARDMRAKVLALELLYELLSRSGPVMRDSPGVGAAPGPPRGLGTVVPPGDECPNLLQICFELFLDHMDTGTGVARLPSNFMVSAKVAIVAFQVALSQNYLN